MDAEPRKAEPRKRRGHSDMAERERAKDPEDLTRLFVERAKNGDADGLTEAQHRETLELFQSDIAPVLRREIPSRPFPVPPARDATDSGPTAG